MALPRILLFPFPAPGHIKPFLTLAEILSDAGLGVVFLSTDHNHHRIANLEALTTRFPTLHFQTISDGLPPDRPRDILDSSLYWSLRNGTKPLFRQLILSFNDDSCADSWPITCIITDMMLSSPIEVAEELGIPIFSFCPCSARYFSMHFWIPKLVEEGQIPYADDNPLGEIHGLPAFEGLLRRKDLPGLWNDESTAYGFSIPFIDQTIATRRSSALILNTFEELEAPFLNHLFSIFNKIYSIGPLHSLSKSRLGDPSLSSSSLRGFWKEDQSCLSWLDSQPSKSVIFISFGSTARLNADELVEFWHGLINSGKSFLCVLRSDVVHSGEVAELMKQLVVEAEGEKKMNGILVEWAPQENVLNHRAVGGFLTHCGWNSIMESIAAGVPMICWPLLGDQTSNATMIDRVWKIGMEMKEKYDRLTVEKTIRALMEDQTGNFQRSIMELSKMANEQVSEGGLSSRNIENLIEDLKRLKPNS